MKRASCSRRTSKSTCRSWAKGSGGGTKCGSTESLAAPELRCGVAIAGDDNLTRVALLGIGDDHGARLQAADDLDSIGMPAAGGDSLFLGHAIDDDPDL